MSSHSPRTVQAIHHSDTASLHREMALSFVPIILHTLSHLCPSPHDIKFSSSANSVRKNFYLVLFILWDLHHLCMDTEFADLLSLTFALGVTHRSTLSPNCTHLNSPRAELPTSVISQPQLLQPSVLTRCSLSLDNWIWTESWTIAFHKNSKYKVLFADTTKHFLRSLCRSCKK